ncbi:branched-chain amino acid ABC transporter permease [Oricola sp.]|uniref:branched-chain amino acid ABC transporter permease n=1 Tax=Oricola sp. TaxID=1979950 RepID=UPI0025D89DD3|nr:branched-chain amino acid ABC transporter permease [Oricola sp.]MCI5075394.1 branched-chain amino acid ABC transporter permease [Oricola sp.]
MAHIAVMVCLMAILALSLNMMLRVGQLSLAQVVFMATGAYGSSLMSIGWGLPPALSVPIAGIGSGFLALVLGPLLLRIRGVYFVLLTFSLGQIVNLILQDMTGVTGGNSGLFGIPRFELFGMRLARPENFYPFALALLALSLAGAAALYRSRAGAVMQSIEQNEDLSRSLGVNVLAWRVGVFGLSGLLAGISGACYAHFIGFISPAAFTFAISVNILVINVIGGVASPLGPLIGAVLLVPLPEVLRDAQQYQLLVYGLLLIGFLAFFPSGITGFLFRKSAGTGLVGRSMKRSRQK